MVLGINLVSVSVAAVAAFLVGMAWYSPLLFGKPYAKLCGADPAKQHKDMGVAYAVTFLVTLVMAFVFAYVVTRTNSRTTVDAAKKAVLLWAGFIVPALSGAVLFDKKPLAFFLIHAGHYLAALLAVSYVTVHFR